MWPDIAVLQRPADAAQVLFSDKLATVYFSLPQLGDTLRRQLLIASRGADFWRRAVVWPLIAGRWLQAVCPWASALAISCF